MTRREPIGEFWEQVEADRLRIEKRLEYLQVFQSNVEPPRSLSTHRMRGAVDFAITGLKAGYLLNGGALVVVPALVKVFEPLGSGIFDLFDALAYFAFGLVLCVVANLLGFKSLYWSSRAQWSYAQAMAVSVKLDTDTVPDRDEAKGRMKGSNDKAQRLDRISGRAAVWAVAAYILAFAAFTAGALLTWFGLSTFPPVDWT